MSRSASDSKSKSETNQKQPYGMIENAALATRRDEIVWIGPTTKLSTEQKNTCSALLDCKGKLITPGLIDCHTHLIYGGSRVNEFEMRLNGASYEDIARIGGGITSTVTATRACPEEQLLRLAKCRLKSFLQEGVTTVEIKSGYGLDLDNELKMLRVARQLGEEMPVEVISTFLGAHAVPSEFQNRSDDYITYICETVLPIVANLKLADSVDAFCENIAFNRQQIAKVFTVAQQYKLPIKLHAEQLSDQKGAVMAAKMGALSVDHLEYLTDRDVEILSENNTAAVLLPGAFYYLRESKLPPIKALREKNVPIAVASDSNPGSSPVSSLLLMLNMACTLFKLTPEESLAGVTCNAAKALGIADKVGSIECGKTANLILWDTDNPAELSYTIGQNHCKQVMYRGQLR